MILYQKFQNSVSVQFKNNYFLNEKNLKINCNYMQNLVIVEDTLIE